MRARLAVFGAVALVLVAGISLVAVLSVGDESQDSPPGHDAQDSTTVPETFPPSTPSTAVTGSTHRPPPSTTVPVPTSSPVAPTSNPSTTPPPVAGRATVITKGDADDPFVALTFDAGSDAGATSRILDLLAEREVTATFGLTGLWVENNPELARRIVSDGHGIINHTQHHLSFTGYSSGADALSTAERVDELREAEAVIADVTGRSPRPWFRPPYGDYDDGVLDDVAAAGYGYVIMWTVDSLGWKGLPPGEVVERTVAALEPGAIVLMHVGDDSTDFDALPSILDAIEDRNLELVSIATLVS